jgi:hypothetical protein
MMIWNAENLVSTHWFKPSDFQSDQLQREESSYDRIGISR